MATDLITKLEEAGEGSRALDRSVWTATGGWSFVDTPPSFTTSLDAALALASRVLGEAVALTILEDTIKAWNETAGLSIKALPAKLCANVLSLQITEN